MTVPAPGTPAFATIDTDDNSVTYTATSANPAARAHAVFPTPDGDRMFVAHDTGNEVSGVDMETGDIFLSVSPIVRAEEVVATRFGDQLWVSSRGDGTVKRIDIATRAVRTQCRWDPILSQPESVMLTPNERTLVVSMRGMPAALAFVDTVKLELIGTVQIGPAGSTGDLAVMSETATTCSRPSTTWRRRDGRRRGGGRAHAHCRQGLAISRHRAPAWNLAFPEEAPVLNRYFSLDPSST